MYRFWSRKVRYSDQEDEECKEGKYKERKGGKTKEKDAREASLVCPSLRHEFWILWRSEGDVVATPIAFDVVATPIAFLVFPDLEEEEEEKKSQGEVVKRSFLGYYQISNHERIAKIGACLS